jgi:molybdate/tungstate transport system permease protein
MSQTLSYAPRPADEPIDIRDWRLTRPRAITVAVVGAVLVALHVLLWQVVKLDGELTIGLFIAHFFAGASASLRWCDSPAHWRWGGIQTRVLIAGVFGFAIFMLFGGISELLLLPVLMFCWWWQGLKTASGFVAGYAIMIVMWWALIRAGGGIEQINLLPLLVMVLFYGALYGRPWLLGYLFVYLFSVRFVPDYLLAATLVLALLYTTLPTFMRMVRKTSDRLIPATYVIGLVLLAVVLMPVVYLATDSSLQDLNKAGSAGDVQAALLLSLLTSGVAMAVVTLLGVPFAYALSRSTFPGKSLVLTAADLPIVIPPPVAGIALLIFLGPRSPLGASLEGSFRSVIDPNSSVGLWLGGEYAWHVVLIVLAQIFVSSPFLIRSSLVAFQGVDSHYERVARTLGAGSLEAFRRVTLPLAMRGIVAGMILCWLRALAEFGSIHVLASYPKTAPILIMERFAERGDLSEAQPIAVLILVMSLTVFLAMWLVRAAPSKILAVARGEGS